MSFPRLKICIEGEYVDSYIYSGYLLLVDSNYRLSVFKWERIFQESNQKLNWIDSLQIMQLILDSRKPIPNISIKEFTISKEKLETSRISTYEIGVWPSDISIYANKLYIASEKGVDILQFEYETGNLSNAKSIFDEMCFSVAPNSYNRLAIAAGKNGLLVLQPTSKKFDSNDIKQFAEDVCIDVDWQSTKLLANTNTGVVEATFEKMPKKDDFEDLDGYFSSLKEIRILPPKVKINSHLESAWVAGDKVISFDKEGQLSKYDIESNELIGSTYRKPQTNLSHARTAAFGTILEFDNVLIALIGSQELNLADDPISWRVFPRAKNFANQLHIVKESYLEISIIESIDNNDHGFNTENISISD